MIMFQLFYKFSYTTPFAIADMNTAETLAIAIRYG